MTDKTKKTLSIHESNLFWTPESSEELNARIALQTNEVQMYMHMHAYTYTYMNTYIHTYTYMYT